ncbi:AbrB family transcriptional regulator [Parasphaerochaeta coccoides]|uniref:Membrane protein AbrB duplication n=1 Tax=Parasphaerochaeta coccoides (strain ATCC BAA-1237 / DSM 17374 / SPN1) TaxID=760011 RepID=F4GLB2_PARC1|nr:AbrB family transcriptional regulator [Parasphaerochaeta coccoides]AEC02944.1 membrane protein AbrB duplication [Parasphaerochaeta coccoides DSM 17374]
MVQVAVTIAVAFLGGFVGKKIRMPNPWMFGSLLAVSIFGLSTGKAAYPSDWKIIAQVIAGAYIGKNITRREVSRAGKIAVPALVSVVLMLVCMTISGFILHKFFGLSLTTALLSSVPGGVADITLMSSDFHADISVVALFQTSRLICVLTLLPQIARFRLRRVPATLKSAGEVMPAANASAAIPAVSAEGMNRASCPTDGTANSSAGSRAGGHGGTGIDIMLTLLAAVAGGVLGKMSGIPAGALSFAMLFTAAYGIITRHARVPEFAKRIAQGLSGALIGSGVTWDFIRGVPSLVVPLVIVLAVYFACNWLVSSVIPRISGMDMETALFATAPGGASDIALIVSDIAPGADQGQVVLMHMIRLVAVVALVPLAVEAFLPFFS